MKSETALLTAAPYIPIALTSPGMMTESDFEARFTNWLRWCQGRYYFQRSQAGSVEGAYRSPQRNVWDPPDPNMKILEPIRNYDAVMVNRAYWQLGDRVRQTIKILWFRPHWREQWKAQKIGCHHTELAELGYRAKRMLKNRLAFLERMR